MSQLSRRSIVKGMLSIAGLSAVSHRAVAALATPRATEGPFYPSASMRMSDVDNDLVKVSGRVTQAGGEIIHLTGRLLSKSGEPLAGHRIEIWQCDVNGKYLHTGDDRDIDYDSGFQGFGQDISDANGHYSFRTIKPTVYPGRTPHIHVKVFRGQRELLTTQFYIAGDPNNKRDSLYRRMSDKQAKAVSMAFTTNNGKLEASVNVIV